MERLIGLALLAGCGGKDPEPAVEVARPAPRPASVDAAVRANIPDAATPSAPNTPRTAKVTDVAMNERLTCAVRDDGRVRCWGYRYAGHDRPSSAVPVELPGIDNAVAINLELDGAVFAVLADGRVATSSVRDFSAIPKKPHVMKVHDATRIYGGRYILHRDGSVGQFGKVDGRWLDDAPIDELVHVAAMTESRVLFEDGRFGALLQGKVRKPYGENGVAIIGSYVRVKDGTLVGWSSSDERTTVTDELPANATQLASAGQGTVCVLVDGDISCKGDNRFGQLGAGPGPSRAKLARVELPARAVQIRAGHRSFCAVLDSGELWCWGANDGGQLGDGTLRDRDTPVRVDHATSAKPPPRNPGFDQAQEGPVFDWSGLPAPCKRPADMIDDGGEVWVKPVASAYVYRDRYRTQIAFAGFLLDPRGYASSYSHAPTRGKQKAIVVELTRGPDKAPLMADRGRYSSNDRERKVAIQWFRGDRLGGFRIGEGWEVRAEITHYDASWLCGTLTLIDNGKTFVRPLAARVTPPLD